MFADVRECAKAVDRTVAPPSIHLIQPRAVQQPVPPRQFIGLGAFLRFRAAEGHAVDDRLRFRGGTGVRLANDPEVDDVCHASRLSR